ncbi:expressed unknown protein [Seminavis robusta]|uniref:Hint domain-containing protein n=1 Tax=Seminavis robusta TaxID=568900 RepID=A0A9N8D7T5_9STRA|nr:expressed unknown protein [Seminavis robusta]|eukprot:Sro28_g018751.1  (411) ;mRNA; f:99596-100828
MKIVSAFTIITGIVTLMTTSCSASVCLTLNIPDNLGAGTMTAIPAPTGTTDVTCDVACTAGNNRVRMFQGGTSGDTTTSCGTSVSAKTSADTLFVDYFADSNLNLVITCSCDNLSTAAPTPVPASSCFSEEATVAVEQPGQGQAPVPTKMTELEIGDMVLTANNRFLPIYAFAHNDATTDTEFLQIYTTSAYKPLEVTGQHLVYVQGKDAPVTAKSIKVGDSLSHAQAGHGQDGAAVVTKIETAQRQGIYAPLTQDGTLVVDGIATSCYISLQPNGDPQTMELQGHGHSVLSMFSHHRVAHLLMTVPRLVCMGGINPKWCQKYNNDGVAHFVQMAFDLSDWFHAQHWVVQLFLLAVFLVVLSPLYALELLFGSKLAAVTIVGGLVFLGFVHGNNSAAAAVDPSMDLKKEV